MLAILAGLELTAFTYLSYRCGRKNVLYPWFLFNIALLLSFGIVLLNGYNWNIHIYPVFILAIIVTDCAFFLGCLCSNGIFSRWKIPAKDGLNSTLDKLKQPYPVKPLLWTSVILALVYFVDRMGVSGFLDVTNFTTNLRHVYKEGYDVGFVVNQFLEICGGMAFVAIYKTTADWFLQNHKKPDWRILMPVFMYMVCILISTDRNKLVRLIIYSVVLYMVFYLRRKRSRQEMLKLLKLVAMAGVVSLLVFFLFGKLKNYRSDIFRSLSLYGGSGMYNFNLWLNAFHTPFQYGKETFSSIQNVFASLHLLPKSNVADFYEYISFVAPSGADFSSNVYSAMRTYFQDFGWLGLVLFPFMNGLFFQSMYLWMKRRPYTVSWILYSMLIYPVFFFPVAEQFFKRMHLGSVYEIGWVLIFYWIAFHWDRVRSWFYA